MGFEGRCRVTGIGGLAVSSVEEALAVTSADRLLGRFRELVAKLVSYGLDRQAILRQSLLTPSCGLGSRPPGTAHPAFAMARAISQALQREDMAP